MPVGSFYCFFFLFLFIRWEFARCRHQALDRALLRPTASYAGDPEECRRADGSPQEPGIGNVFDGSGDRAAFAGAGGRSRGA